MVDCRDHIGGNAYDYYNEDGILIHKYGPHIFHTNCKPVFDYLSQFTEWIDYEHRVLSSVNGMNVPVPINRDTLNQIYGFAFTSDKEVAEYLDSVREKIARPANSEEMVVGKVGWDLYEKLFKHYTIKQWGIHPRELMPSVTGRIPVRLNNDPRYFTDTWQKMPRNGYTEMFRNMLKSPKITLLLNTDYRKVLDILSFDRMIFTGPIDEFFDHVHGPLPYRALDFKHETIKREWHQEVASVNYPNENGFTRITEWKHMTGQKHPATTITREYPKQAVPAGDKYYPIPREENQKVYGKYLEESRKLDSVLFCGRLAEYKYYNMDQVVASALNIFKEKLPKTQKGLSVTPSIHGGNLTKV